MSPRMKMWCARDYERWVFRNIRYISIRVRPFSSVSVWLRFGWRMRRSIVDIRSCCWDGLVRFMFGCVWFVSDVRERWDDDWILDFQDSVWCRRVTHSGKDNDSIPYSLIRFETSFTDFLFFFCPLFLFPFCTGSSGSAFCIRVNCRHRRWRCFDRINEWIHTYQSFCWLTRHLLWIVEYFRSLRSLDLKPPTPPSPSTTLTNPSSSTPPFTYPHHQPINPTNSAKHGSHISTTATRSSSSLRSAALTRNWQRIGGWIGWRIVMRCGRWFVRRNCWRGRRLFCFWISGCFFPPFLDESEMVLVGCYRAAVFFSVFIPSYFHSFRVDD